MSETRVVDVPVCERCIRGEGGECHVPGCSFFLFPAPPEGANSLGKFCLSNPPRDKLMYPGAFADEQVEFPDHTPWMKFTADGSGPLVIRCGSPELLDCHASFADIFKWADHVLLEAISDAPLAPALTIDPEAFENLRRRS